jgi:hypothetical protein
MATGSLFAIGMTVSKPEMKIRIRNTGTDLLSRFLLARKEA